MSALFKKFIFGPTRDPLAPESRRSIALVAFLAWVGLGADGLSSSCYGPELSYLSLGAGHHHLALYLALLTAITVFIIALSYNQVIELFPNGGGGYKVANTLLGPLAGVVSGSALLIDYLLTIAISIASATDAIYSILPPHLQQHKVITEMALIGLLTAINLRGSKESIKVLLPIFMGFIITHALIIIYGIFAHHTLIPQLIHETVRETHEASQHLGWLFLVTILLRAYSHGSGTYTGLEAVSNNVNMLAEPRIRTGKMTMLYMALSLSLIAGGIIFLYLLWHVSPIQGQTLNATAFSAILGSSQWGHLGLSVLMLFEMGLLIVGANTGFLGGPAVLANMSVDDWVPKRFGALSSRLVKQNGILFFGLSSMLTIILSQGKVDLLVIFYSINVFITFSVSLLGLMAYWFKHRSGRWLRSLIFSSLAFLICITILVVILITRFFPDGGLAILFTTCVILICYHFQQKYKSHEKLKKKLDQSLEINLGEHKSAIPVTDHDAPTAVFLVNRLGAAIHTILWVERLFPNHFKNYIFVSYGIVETANFGSEQTLSLLQTHTDRTLSYLENYASHKNIASESRSSFGTQAVEDMVAMAEDITSQFNHTVFFGARYIYPQETIIGRMLHSDFSLMVQRCLQNSGVKMLIIPLQLEI